MTTTLETVCGKEFIIDTYNLEKLKYHTFYWCVTTLTINCRNRRNPDKTKLYAHLRLTSVLFNTNISDRVPFFKDGNRRNLTEKNVKIITKAELFRKREKLYNMPYKGVHKLNEKTYMAKAVLKNGKLATFCNKNTTDIEAAGLYNAVLDYCKIKGYRNKVPKIELTEKQKKYIRKRGKQTLWGT